MSRSSSSSWTANLIDAYIENNHNHNNIDNEIDLTVLFAINKFPGRNLSVFGEENGERERELEKSG